VFLYEEATSRYEPYPLNGMDAKKRADALRGGYKRCPNPSDDTPEHYLPATYAQFEDPLVIGLVGLTSAGKTHLLTAIIREAHRGGLMPLGVRTTSLDRQRHKAFSSTYIEPFDKGKELPSTSTGRYDAADVLLLRGGGKVRPVTFFDVAGEDLADYSVLNRSTRFLLSVNAAIFVHAAEDPGSLPASAGTGENPAFDLAAERMVNLPGGSDIPVAIALTKADRLRYLPPVDRWLRRAPGHDLSWLDSRVESRDVYAYLYRHGGISSLAPFEAFRRCTLHFVSASGGDSDRSDPARANAFPRGVRPARVLEPFIALLAMSGFLTGPEAGRVGLW
jgi:hypothetical protein